MGCLLREGSYQYTEPSSSSESRPAARRSSGTPAFRVASLAASTGLVSEMDSLGRPARCGTATATDSTPVARSSAEYA